MLVTRHDNWHLRANPGYWGDSKPEVLILGFSKGANQLQASESGTFDRVAFAKARVRLGKILDVMGVSLHGQTLDQALTASGKGIGVASLIRCGISLDKHDKLITSGPVMVKAMSDKWSRDVMERCVRSHLLSHMPSSVQRILLLGNADEYVLRVKKLMASVFVDYRDLNKMSFTAIGRTWIFSAHPAGGNGHFNEWAEGDASTGQGYKRWLAQSAFGMAA